MTDELTTLAWRLAASPSGEDVFGPIGTPDERKVATQAYRRLARLAHPDVQSEPGRRELAEEVFGRLSTLWDQYTSPDVLDPVLTSTNGSYEVGRLVQNDGVCDIYETTALVGDGSVPAAVKIARHQFGDDHLVAREGEALAILGVRGDAKYKPYVPSLVDHFTFTYDKTKANVVVVGPQDPAYPFVPQASPELVTLADVRDAFPQGLDPRDAAWMWRRLLVAIGFAHRSGVVHAGICPSAVLVHPRHHGLVLTQWYYSAVEVDQPALSHPTAWQSIVAPEVLDGKPVSPATDIYMACKTVALLMGHQTPAKMRLFIEGCTAGGPAARPQDAWALLRELDELLEQLYGPRKFRPFAMPTSVRA